MTPPLVRRPSAGLRRVLSGFEPASEHGLPQYLFDGRDARLDLLDPAHAEGEHPLLEGLPPELHRGGPDQDEIADRLGDLHDLVEAHPALVARAVAGPAPAALVELERPYHLGRHPDLDEGRGRKVGHLELAGGADAADEARGPAEVDPRAHPE